MDNIEKLGLEILSVEDLADIEGGTWLSWALGFLAHNLYDLAEMSASCPSNMGK